MIGVSSITEIWCSEPKHVQGFLPEPVNHQEASSLVKQYRKQKIPADSIIWNMTNLTAGAELLSDYTHLMMTVDKDYFSIPIGAKLDVRNCITLLN